MKRLSFLYLFLIFTSFSTLFFTFTVTGQVSPDNGSVICIEKNQNDYLFTLKQFIQKHDPYYDTYYNHSLREDDLIFVIDTAYNYSLSDNPRRYNYTYSNTGERLSTLLQKNIDDEWENFTLNENTYDILGNRIFEVWKSWVNNNWTNESRVTFIYSSDNYLLSSIEELWVNGSWVNNERGTYSYNTGGQVVSHVIELWNEDAWENNSKDIYVYDDFGNMTYALGMMWHIDVWQNESQYTYTYDENNNLITGLYESWEDGDWSNISKDSSVYNETNMKTMYLYETWNDSLWVNSFKYDYLYNDLDYLATRTMENWQESTWVNSEKIQFSYGSYGGVESELKQIWEEAIWVDYSMYQYNYDDYGNALEGNFYYWDGLWTQNQDGPIQIAYDYSTKLETYFGYHVHAAYSSMLVGINEARIANNNISAGPNPTRDIFSINLKISENRMVKVELYSIGGQYLYSIFDNQLITGSHNITINTKQIPAGIYMVKIKLGIQQHNVKMVVIK